MKPMLVTPEKALVNTSSTALQNGLDMSLSNGRFVSHIFTDTSGQSFRLTFFVTIVGGEAKGHLVSAQPISEVAPQLRSPRGATSEIFCLPVACSINETETAYIPAYAPIVSPFTELFFFTSQPTRAPSHA